MKIDKIVERLNLAYLRLRAKLQTTSHRDLGVKRGASTTATIANDLYAVSYSLFSKKTRRILPLFSGLDSSLLHSGIKVNFKAYVTLTVLTATVLSFIVAVTVPLFSFFVIHVPYFPAILFGTGGGLLTFAFSIIGFLLYPTYRSDRLKRELDDELPFTAGYMAILTSAGVSPENIFSTLSNLSLTLEASTESRNIVRDVDLFGKDIISALTEASRRTPSLRFREMIEGLISTIHSGGSLEGFLQEKTRHYMKLKRISLRKFSDTLSVLSEFYVAILITGPLLLVIMLAVMVLLGGDSLGMLKPDLLLNLVTYIGLPIGSIMFLIVLDAISPKW